MARGDFVAFIDDDAVPDEDWLVDAIAAFDSDEVAGVGGFVYDHTGYELQYSYTVCDRMGNAYHDIPMPMPEFAIPDAYRYPGVARHEFDLSPCQRCWRSADSTNNLTIFSTRPTSTCGWSMPDTVLKQIPNAFVYHRLSAQSHSQ